MIEIVSIVYLLIGAAMCLWLQRGGNAGNWYKYLVVVFSWPALIIAFWPREADE